jgi:hypothetical protein
MNVVRQLAITSRVAIGISLLAALPSFAEGVYLEPAEFVAEVFDEAIPDPQLLWITGTMRDEVQQILGRDVLPLRIRYWQKDTRTAWVLDEIGKDQLITTGVVVNAGVIETIQVLVFRESRGWEVRYPFFTGQFIGARIDSRMRLDRSIDGISGATLSVDALKRQARLALLLTQYTNSAANLP